MALKELNFVIKVDGKEIDLAKTSVKDFQKVYQDTSKKINSLPIGSDEYKTLNKELKNADTAFQQTKQILGETENKFKSLRVQIRQATVAFQEAETKGDLAGMKKAKQQIDELNDQFEIATLKSMQLDDALAQLPGVMGFVGQSIQGVDKGFKLLVANPILAIVSALVGAFTLMKEALGKTSKGQETLNKVSSAFSKLLGPLLALIEKIAIPIFEKFADIISFVADGFSWLVESMGVSSKDIQRVTKEIDTVSQEAAEKEKERQEEAKKREEERKKKAEEAAQKAKELAAARKQAAQDEININESVKQSEVELARAKAQTTDDELQNLHIEQSQKDQDYQRELKRINDLLKLEKKGSNEYKALIVERNNLEKDYVEDKTARTTEIVQLTEEQVKAERDFNDKVRDIQIAAMTDETARAIAAREEEKARDLRELEEDKEFIKKSEEEKAAIRKDVTAVAEADIQKIRDEVTAKQLEDNNKKLEEEKQYNQLVLQARTQLLDATIALAGEETKVGRALMVFKQLMLLQETMLDLKRITFKGTKAVAEASMDAASNVSASSKIGFPQNLITIAAAIAQGVALVAAVKSAFSKAKGNSPEGGGTPTPPNLGRNYANGGLIGGRRHAQGGTLIEAEAGEAIMTRGAVTMFAPMLSRMNQMGGGTNFAPNAMVTLPDNPKTQNPAQEQSPLIMKTYVVENELTTMQQRQARLKDLSTL